MNVYIVYSEYGNYVGIVNPDLIRYFSDMIYT